MASAYEKAIQDAVLARCSVERSLAPAGEIIQSAIRSGAQDPAVKASAAEFVRQTVTGAVKGLVLAEVDLSAAALKLLDACSEAAQAAELDPGEAMTWAIEGISRAVKVIQPQVLLAMQEELEAAFMGVGALFADLCRKERETQP